MPNLLIRHFPRVDYPPCWQAMKTFTDQRDEHTPDELWFLEHPDVFTLGQAGKPEHVLNPGPIPLVQTDRGGQVTWHGPGQTVGYLLFDIARMGIGARELVADDKICKVSLVGVGMRSHAGVASKMFATLARENINIQMISTSEIKISVVIAEKYLELAVRSLHAAFELDKPAV